MFYKTVTYEETREQFLKPQEWIGYEVYDPLNHKIGQAEEIHVNASDAPDYIRVRIGFLRPKTVLIPVHLAAADAERRVIELR